LIFVSTRDARAQVPLARAIVDGIAADGGLYVPQAMPMLAARSQPDGAPLDACATRVLAPFFADDALAGTLPALAAEALDFPAPLRPVGVKRGRLSILELFHGPTAAFKDFGARFLAACLARLRPDGTPALTVLVATSGDTGGAVAAAFLGRPGMRVVLLFPEGRVSPVQEQQLTCWGGNVQSLAVRGGFDDCQRLVKAAFADGRLRRDCALTSANSINLGRLLPQVALVASAALSSRASGTGTPGFVIPSGNLGLATACAWARAMGLPIGPVVLAHNANRTVPDFMAGGAWAPRASVPTLASAMDVGDPSNMERLFALYPDDESLRRAFRAMSIDDAAIRESMRTAFREHAIVACPHTAAGLAAWRGLPEDERCAGHWIVAATAHPAKFRETVEPAIGRRVEPPEALATLPGRPRRFLRIAPDIDELARRLRDAPCTP
jgi:threonine synthase